MPNKPDTKKQPAKTTRAATQKWADRDAPPVKLPAPPWEKEEASK